MMEIQIDNNNDTNMFEFIYFGTIDDKKYYNIIKSYQMQLVANN